MAVRRNRGKEMDDRTRTEESEDAPGWPMPIRTRCARATLDVVSRFEFMVTDYIRKRPRI